MEFLFEYGLFLAKAITVVVSIAVIIGLAVGAGNKPKSKSGEIELKNISEQIDKTKSDFLEQTLDKKALKAYLKAQKKSVKSEGNNQKGNVFVIEFNGSIDAKEVSSLREEVSAILTVANSAKDTVLVNLESGGGVVHGYGLAASQLARLKQHDLSLTVCVDKIAASGGYMMACVADKIIAAPFAIVGSIGVVAQIPNFNKILKKNDVELEQITAGEYKRTLTMFGENTDKGREKFKADIEDTHGLFKEFVLSHRDDLEIDKVATGEHWFATQAKTLKLVDEIKTSDDVLRELNDTHNLYKVTYKIKKPMSEKLGLALSKLAHTCLVSLWSKATHLKSNIKH